MLKPHHVALVALNRVIGFSLAANNPRSSPHLCKLQPALCATISPLRAAWPQQQPAFFTRKRFVITSCTPACQKHQKQPSKATSIKKDAAKLEIQVAGNGFASAWYGSASVAARTVALRMAVHMKQKP